MNPIIFSPTSRCEFALATYISASLSGSASVYMGIDNADKVDPPCVIVACKDAQEVYFNTRNYKFDVELIVKEMAYDSTEDSFSNIAGNVAAFFADSSASCASMNSYFSSSQLGINLYQAQIGGYNESVDNDAWVNNFSFSFIGAFRAV